MTCNEQEPRGERIAICPTSKAGYALAGRGRELNSSCALWYVYSRGMVIVCQCNDALIAVVSVGSRAALSTHK